MLETVDCYKEVLFERHWTERRLDELPGRDRRVDTRDRDPGYDRDLLLAGGSSMIVDIGLIEGARDALRH